ncbi:unnamed protein product [Prorocentrum cordatum]|uniref:Uncharacterized protein n=1 Tax=Prorocentrum cordatum TaxID=2364126 RepID=A0ABN9UBD6_9DINO|nr:unnamed protein product [Polarella glacialis]
MPPRGRRRPRLALAALALAAWAARDSWARAARRPRGDAFVPAQPRPPDRKWQRLTPAERAALRLQPAGAAGRARRQEPEPVHEQYHRSMRPVYLAAGTVQLALLAAAALSGAASQAARSLELEMTLAPGASACVFSLSGAV